MGKNIEIKQTFHNGNSRKITIESYEWGVRTVELWYRPNGWLVLALTRSRNFNKCRRYPTIESNIRRAKKYYRLNQND